MRATCGVLSARRPSVRPLSWSTSLKVCRSSACPVPESSDSMCSSIGGMTSSKPNPAAASSRPRRRDSMWRARAGRTSAMCSGRSQAEDMRKRRLLKTRLYGSAAAGQAQATAPRGSHRERRPIRTRRQQHRQPARTLTRPRKRIWPSLICSARSKMRRHATRTDERQQSFGDQHQRDGAERDVPERGRRQSLPFRRWRAGRAAEA